MIRIYAPPGRIGTRYKFNLINTNVGGHLYKRHGWMKQVLLGRLREKREAE
jgi:hypothetical protein